VRTYIDFEAANKKADAMHGRKDSNARRRNALARKTLESRRDRELLRSHIEEVWNSAGPVLHPTGLQCAAYTEMLSLDARSGVV